MAISVKNYGNLKKTKSCTAIFVDNNSIIDTYDEKYKTLDTTTFGKKYNLLINSSLYNLPSIKNSLPTCFLISNNNGKKLIITARHVLEYGLIKTISSTLDELFTKISVVFGYDDMHNNHSIATKEIFKIVGVYNDTYNAKTNPHDFVILEIKDENNLLDKKQSSIQIGKLSETEIEIDNNIYTQGYPYGMPLYKSYGKLEAKETKKTGYYISSLSAFNGHSGSPVFNSNHEIIGIIFGGSGDFEYVKKKTNKKTEVFRKLKYRKFKLEKENGIYILPIKNIINYL
ncbi:MAG: trypsin-like peptidase domain-containing protein [Sphingobacteriales bacterium]|nr:MAG: trypsin-like peptidase domain-containing protein [Sphingobacteriales bacterium]